MKKIILVFIFNLFLTIACFAQSNYNETLTITTYYPSPYGVYRNLQLHPSEEPEKGRRPGVMYFNKTREEVLVYKNDSIGFVPVGGASASDALVYFVHTKSDCENHVPRGYLEPSDVAFPICRFILPACPAGWTWYKYYRTAPYGQAFTTGCPVPLHRCDEIIPQAGGLNVCNSFPALGWGNNPLRTYQFTICCQYFSSNPSVCESWFNSQSFSELEGSSATEVGCY